MQPKDAIKLNDCKELPTSQAARWAHLECGSGLFSTALSAMLPAGSTIYAADKQLPTNIPGEGIQLTQLDFVKDPLPFEQLDGILMANALHYVKDKSAFLAKARRCLRPGGYFLFVEYDTEQAVPVWVPYPVSYQKLATLFPDNKIKKLGERPSIYGRTSMYAALVP